MIENACVNRRSAAPACEDDAGQVVEDPLSGGPALLMVARGGPKGLAAPRWLTAVPTDICVEGDPGRHRSWCCRPALGSTRNSPWTAGTAVVHSVAGLNYVAVRQDGIRINREPPRKRLDSRAAKGAGAWSLRAAVPRKGPGGDWVQQLVLAPVGGASRGQDAHGAHRLQGAVVRRAQRAPNRLEASLLAMRKPYS